MNSTTPLLPPTITTPALRKHRPERRDGITCGEDSAGLPITCSINFSCVINNAGLSSCQPGALQTYVTFPNYTTTSQNGSTPQKAPTAQGSKSVTISNSLSNGHTTTDSGSPATKNPSLTYDSSFTATDSGSPATTNPSLTYDSSFTTSILMPTTKLTVTKLTATTTSTRDGDPGCSSLRSCTTTPSTNTPSLDPGVNISNVTGTGMMGNTTLPIVLPIVVPSVFIVICAMIVSAIGNRRKWISRASRAYRARQLRRNRADSAQPGRDSIEGPILLRDMQTPPPAYTPYHFSQADREWLGVAYPVRSLHGHERPVSGESEMIGQAYPQDDRGRHRST